MPLIVITLKNTPPSLRGDLSKWMQEISTGVYVGNVNTKVRERLWQRILENVDEGQATMCFAQRNEIGYDFLTNSKDRSIVDFDGIPLVMVVNNKNKDQLKSEKLGFSKASKLRKARKYQKSQGKTNPYIVLDLETTGLDYINDRIIEIGCIKVDGAKIEEFQRFIKIENSLDESIVKLTGITDENLAKKGQEEKKVLLDFLAFIQSYPLVSYGNNFDINFINQALARNNLGLLKNKAYDLMKYVKKENIMLENYKLQTALGAYGIEKKVPHRALEDAKLTNELIDKVKEFKEKIK